jgi:hypothetical protein
MWQIISGKSFPDTMPPKRRSSSIRRQTDSARASSISSSARTPARSATSHAIPQRLRVTGATRKTFTLQSVTPLDMFPQTAEIEAFAHLTR